MKRSKWCKYCERDLTNKCQFQKHSSCLYITTGAYFNVDKSWSKIQSYRDWLSEGIRYYRNLKDKWELLKSPEDRAYHRARVETFRQCAKQLRMK